MLAVIAIPGTLLLQRVGGSTNLSLSDLLVIVATLMVLPLVRWESAQYLWQFLKGIAFYEIVLIVVVAAHPNHYDVIEWGHRAFVVGGSALIGWVCAVRGHARLALRLYLLGATALAIITILHAISGHLSAVNFGLYQKNAIGTFMWIAVVVAVLRPSWTGLGRWESRSAATICLIGLLASQSRQSIIVLIVAFAVAVLRRRSVLRRSKLAIGAVVPLGVFAYVSLQAETKVNVKFNSITTRENQFTAALNVWHHSPLLGEGMRFYNLKQYVSVTAPPNVVIDNLASTGIVGMAGFLALVAMTVRPLLRLPAAIGTLGLAVLVGRYTQGLFDIFWVGANGAIAFMIVGLALGAGDAAATARRNNERANPTTQGP